jgi:xanthine dehydrogenase small subunit
VSTAGEAGNKVRESIRFVLDDEVIELQDVDPTRTVLQFLREDLKRPGTKEGCAEGDCGACTVVIAELDHRGEDLTVRAINSCIQFLPTLDGKELITVESLTGPAGELHPVQQAMVDCHGSQCGFCTPGFVMSLFALYKNEAAPTRHDIDVALAGNLCRCTGYRPIVDAAVQMYDDSAAGQGNDWLRSKARAPDAVTKDGAQRVRRLQSLRSADMLAVGNEQKRFFAPRSVDELAALCGKYPTAILLAGGTDIGLWVTKQYRELGNIIYTGCVEQLKKAAITDTHIEIGAAVPLTDAMTTIVEHYPSLDELFLRFASPPIRNAGTLGGNIANGSPIGDSMPALMVLDTILVLRSSAGARTIALSDFYVAYQQTALEEGEFLEKVLIPLPVAGEQLASYKISKRFDQDISAVCGAYRRLPDGAGAGDIRIAYGGMAAVPQRATACENALRGRSWNAQHIAEARQALAQDYRPISDMRSSAAYRMQVAQNLLQRFYQETTGGDVVQVYRYGR